MPTFERTPEFGRDYRRLTQERQRRFRTGVRALVEDLRAGRRLRAGLRVRGVRDAPGVYEMTWAPDGRATFEYGPSIRAGDVHIIWRRVGTHDIFDRP